MSYEKIRAEKGVTEKGEEWEILLLKKKPNYGYSDRPYCYGANDCLGKSEWEVRIKSMVGVPCFCRFGFDLLSFAEPWFERFVTQQKEHRNNWIVVRECQTAQEAHEWTERIKTAEKEGRL